MDTAPAIGLDELGLEHPDRNEYSASNWVALMGAFRGLEISPADVFVDFGSGMGRVALQAARRPFGQVVGIELSQRLTEAARHNLEAARDRLACRDVQFVTADASEVPIPDQMTVAYLFNPFRGETFQRLLLNIVASLDRRPRELTIIYVHPVEQEAIIATGRFRLVRRIRGRRRLRRPPRPDTLVFRSTAPG